MAEKPLIEQLIHRVYELTRIIMEHQATIVALVAYQREQPTYDVGRMATLYEEQRALLKLPKGDLAEHDAALLALLRDFEGPIQ